MNQRVPMSRRKKIVIVVTVTVIAVLLVTTLALVQAWITQERDRQWIAAQPPDLSASIPTAGELDIRGTEEGRLVEEYLLLKYGEEFELGETEIQTYNWGQSEEKSTIVYPKANPEVIARINTTRIPDLNNPEDKKAYEAGYYYGDSYVDALWDWQYNNDIAPLMKDLFGENIIFEANLSWIPDSYPVYPWYGRIVSYDEAWGLGEQQLLKLNAIVFSENGEILVSEVQQLISDYSSQVDNYVDLSFTIGFYKHSDKDSVVQQLEGGKGFVLDYVDDDILYKAEMMALKRTVYQQEAIILSTKEQLSWPLENMRILRGEKYVFNSYE